MIKIAIVENEPQQIKTSKEMIERYFKDTSYRYEIEAFENGYDFLEENMTSFDIIFIAFEVR